MGWIIPPAIGPVDSTLVSWKPLGELGGMNETQSLQAAVTTLNITGLEEYFMYSISASFQNTGGEGPSTTIQGITLPTSKEMLMHMQGRHPLLTVVFQYNEY